MLKKIEALSYECNCSSMDEAYSGVEEPGVNFWLGYVPAAVRTGYVQQYVKLEQNEYRQSKKGSCKPVNA